MVLILWLLLPLIAMGMFKPIWWGLDPGRSTDLPDITSYLDWLREDDV